MPITRTTWHRLAGPRGRKADIRTPGIRQIADRLEPSMRRKFLRAIANLNGNIDWNMLADAVRYGALTPEIQDVFNREWPVDLAPAVAVTRTAFATAAGLAADSVATGLRVSFAFNLENPRAAEWGSMNSARLVTEVTDQTREGIARIIGRAFTEGRPPEEAARMIRPMLGLTERGTTAVGNYWDALVKEGRTAEEVARLSERYSNKLLRHRSLTIARTETVRSANAGQQETWRQAVEAGLLDRDATLRVWTVADDERLCDECSALDGEEVGLEESFSDGSFQPPDPHPNCRCSVVLRIERGSGSGRSSETEEAA